MVLGSVTPEEVPAAAPKLLHQAAAFEAGLAGLATASAAISLAVREPPPAVAGTIHQNVYALALSGCFFIAVAQVGAAVRALSEEQPHGRRHAARSGRWYASLVLLAAAVGLSVPSVIW